MKTVTLAILLITLLATGCSGPQADEGKGHQPHEAHKADDPTAEEHKAEDHSEHKHGDPTGMTFEDVEFYASRFDAPERDAWQKPEEVVALLELAEGAAVADLGAGTGYFLPALSAAVGPTGSVVGLDVSPPMVEYMQKRAADAGLSNVTARVVQGDDPGIEADSMDRILIVNTWHHIPEREAYGGKLLAGLASGGRLMIVDFTKESERGPKKAHKLTAEEVIAELESAGFAATLVTETLPDQYIVVGTRP